MAKNIASRICRRLKGLGSARGLALVDRRSAGDVNISWLRRHYFDIELAVGRVRPLADKGLLDPPARAPLLTANSRSGDYPDDG
jgi:hypothetical protein